MKSVTYKELVDYYGYNSCNNEFGCILSRSAHRRGQITHWRGDTLHWFLDRNVTRPGLVGFLRLVGDDTKSPPPGATWSLHRALPCMWAQREAKEKWGVSIPPSSFRNEKKWLSSYFAELKRTGQLTPEMMTSPEYLWSHTNEEK